MHTEYKILKVKAPVNFLGTVGWVSRYIGTDVTRRLKVFYCIPFLNALYCATIICHIGYNVEAAG